VPRTPVGPRTGSTARWLGRRTSGWMKSPPNARPSRPPRRGTSAARVRRSPRRRGTGTGATATPSRLRRRRTMITRRPGICLPTSPRRRLPSPARDARSAAPRRARAWRARCARSKATATA
jgi:hypothetical protein